jgi:hypothetical protein
MKKLKAGNTVKILKSTQGYGGKFKVGDTGLIEGFQNGGHLFVTLIGDNDNNNRKLATCWHDVNNIELAEDTSKPVTVTHEGNVYEVGKRYVFTDSLPLGDDFTVSRLNFIYVPNSDPSYVFDSEGLPYRYAVSLSEVNLDAGTITPAPIELIDGNAYMFDLATQWVGFYIEDRNSFFSGRSNGNKIAGVSECTNIRPMTVTESK